MGKQKRKAKNQVSDSSDFSDTANNGDEQQQLLNHGQYGNALIRTDNPLALSICKS